MIAPTPREEVEKIATEGPAMSEESMARKALQCLFIAADKYPFAADVQNKCVAAFDCLHRRIREAYDERDHALHEKALATDALLLAEANGLRRAAAIAKAHEGAASRIRAKRKWSIDPDAWQAIWDEERGEKIASEIIARDILSLATELEAEAKTEKISCQKS